MRVLNSAGKNLKEPFVRLKGKELQVVDSEGCWVVTLYDFEDMRACPALGKLELEGFRTDFAEWDYEGKMVKLLEPFDN